MFQMKTIRVPVVMRYVEPLKLNCSYEDIINFKRMNNIDTIPVINEENRVIGFLDCNLENLNYRINDPFNIEDFISRDVNSRLICENDFINLSTFDKYEELYVVNKDGVYLGIISRIDYLKRIDKDYEFILESYRLILNVISHAVIAIDSNSKVVIFNKAAQEMLGVECKDAIGKDIFEVNPNTFLTVVLKTGEIITEKKVMLRGRPIVSSRFPITKDGRVIGAIGIFKDITERDKLLKELDEEKTVSEMLNTIIETVYDGILMVDKDGYITLISKAYAKFLGVDENEVIGKHVTDVIENTRMHIVAKTGIPEYADVQKIKGGHMIASRIPLIKDGKVVGAVGKVLFRNMDEFNRLQKRISCMEKELEKYKGEIKQMNSAKYSFDSIIGESRNMVEAKKYAIRAAQGDSNILILGESGTGKELFAHSIHKKSERRYGPFIKINCAAIPSELLESELFGYEEGAFTGAKKGGKIGKFELADGGTIFLDEIGDMPLNMQAKLLRVIQEREVERIGGTTARSVNVRIIAATHRDLEKMVQENKFREDLFYRLNVLTIQIPPLRERREDIKLLSYHFLEEISKRLNKYVDKITDGALKCLYNYDWPGNIRELSNVIERAVNIIDNEDAISCKHLPQKIIGENYAREIRPLQEVMEETERNVIIEALRICNGNRSKAAKLLNISRSTLYEKLLKFDLLDK